MTISKSAPRKVTRSVKYFAFESETTDPADESFGKFGVVDSPTSLLYEAMFTESVAKRLAELENRDSPPEDWEAARAILVSEGLFYEDGEGTTETYREGRQLAVRHVAAGGDLHAPGPGPRHGKLTETQEERYNGFIDYLAEERRKHRS